MLINAQLIADQFAANGYFVVVPDLFHGDPMPLERPAGFDFFKWLKGEPGHFVDRVDPVIADVVKALKGKEFGVQRLGAVGYCYGAKYVVRGLKEGGFLDVGFLAHPSFVEAEELRAITGPLSIAAAGMFLSGGAYWLRLWLGGRGLIWRVADEMVYAETDTIFPAEKRHESEVILKETKQPYQINLYSHVEHGFAVRVDLSKKENKFAKEQAFYQAVQWFDEYLKQ